MLPLQSASGSTLWMMIILMLAENLGLGIAQSQRIETTRYAVALPPIADNQVASVRFLHLSDLHCNDSGEDNQYLVNLVEMNDPDIIVATGDMIDADAASIDGMVDFFRRLAQVAPVFYCPGNHEEARGDLKKITSALQDVGVAVLYNSVSLVNVNGVILRVGGVAHPSRIKSVIKGDPVDILLCHVPAPMDALMKNKVPLTFSGDTHGGQVRIPLMNLPIYAPGQGLFPKYGAGHYMEDGSHMIVSRGLGDSSFPFRVNNPPELIVADVSFARER